ncbi:MAG: hypothetical protein BWK76_01270 [Desulfobulbaceae bacterium A2]|nr:MAG: hypothetical protein BWK76_01270 [Desulfobulbaceae bacterium A2]
MRIGRDPANEIQLQDVAVSRFHAEIILLAGTWWLHDLDSANGVLVNNERIQRLPIRETTTVDLGAGGPRLTLSVAPAVQTPERQGGPMSLSDCEAHYFGDADTAEGAGERTIMVRRAFARIQKKQKKTYWGIIAVVTCMCMFAGGIAIHKHQQLKRQKALAAEIFFSIKALELQFAEYIKTARDSKDAAVLAQVAKYQQEKTQLESNYTKFLDDIGVYHSRLSPQDHHILRVARLFGECEILMPPDFLKEVHRYIKKWQTTDRYRNAIKRALENGYCETIVTTMRLNDLPGQFLYIALQESNFDVHAVGPETKYGIAKGMWQFIPSTARELGLATGPLAKVRRADPQDERQDFAKSTKAAAQYLRMIYDTDAQASGLLVVASYNWGQNRVNKLIRQMPHNPRERNFWTFLSEYRSQIPAETYEYVFSIFSAAVIGEDPQLFGFDVKNPLRSDQ